MNTIQTPHLPPDQCPWEHPELRLALAARDITRSFRVLQTHAPRESIPQPEVHKITYGPACGKSEGEGEPEAPAPPTS